jgi:Lrp/AsnC family transcriptional regulator, leucine-responsive regulatory protein
MDSKTNELDELDRRLLQLLQHDASLTHAALAELTFTSAPTVYRRVERFTQRGILERRIAILSPEKLGYGLTAIIELSMETQSSEVMMQMEARLQAVPAIQQVYRVSGGPDFILVMHVPDMQAYHNLVHQLFNHETQVRNVRSFFSTNRSKFEPAIVV